MLSEDLDFKPLVMKACKDNHQQPKDLFKCIGGLYHRASCDFHGHEPDIIIDSLSWKKVEVIALGVIFRHHNVSFLYCDRDGKIVDYPYIL